LGETLPAVTAGGRRPAISPYLLYFFPVRSL